MPLRGRGVMSFADCSLQGRHLSGSRSVRFYWVLALLAHAIEPVLMIRPEYEGG